LISGLAGHEVSCSGYYFWTEGARRGRGNEAWKGGIRGVTNRNEIDEAEVVGIGELGIWSKRVEG
jgi:hypothetical protein